MNRNSEDVFNVLFIVFLVTKVYSKSDLFKSHCSAAAKFKKKILVLLLENNIELIQLPFFDYQIINIHNMFVGCHFNINASTSREANIQFLNEMNRLDQVRLEF